MSEILLPSMNPVVYRPSNHPLNQGLTGWWLPVPGYSGWGSGRLHDIAQYKEHGTLTNMSASSDWVSNTYPGGFGSLDFDGTNDVLVIPGPNHSASLTTFTVVFWVYRRDNNEADYVASHNGSTGYWYIYTVFAGVYRLAFNFNRSTQDVYYDWSQTGFSTNVWTHVALTYTTGSAPILYYNGIQQTPITSSGGSGTYNSVTNNDLQIGGNAQNSSYANTCQMGSVSIWNRRLTIEEIRRHRVLTLQGSMDLLQRGPSKFYVGLTTGVPTSLVSGGKLFNSGLFAGGLVQ